MIDYFKARGELISYFPDKYCLLYSDDLRDTSVIKRMRIPNKSHKRFLIFSYLVEQPHKIRIEGNLRKWWFGEKSAVADLNKSNLNKCVKLIGERLGVDESEIWKLEFSNLELGGNVKLERKYNSLIPSIIDYPRLEMTRFSRKSVKFEGDKYSLIIYDKLQELKDRGKISSETAKRLMEYIFIFRFEIKIGTKSGYVHKDKVKTFALVRDNFDFLVDDWLDRFYKFKIIDLFSGVKEIPRGSMTKREFLDYLVFQKMCEIGIDYTLYLSDTFVKNHKSVSKKELLKIHKKFSDGKKWNYYTHIASSVALKAGQFKR
nr:hypothetical protein [uncultured Psychroserpens sp.]